MSKGFAARELARYDWSRLSTVDGCADQVPASLLSLIAAADEDEAEVYYWDLENVIVVQGQLFEAAPPAVSVLLAGLVDGAGPGARVWVLEMIFQLVTGDSHADAVDRGHSDLGDECRRRAREGLWTLYSALSGPGKALARDILERTDPGRISAFEFGIERKINGLD